MLIINLVISGQLGAVELTVDSNGGVAFRKYFLFPFFFFYLSSTIEPLVWNTKSRENDGK